MKVRLQNIKCYEDETFDFGSEGISLLSGHSGKGKSTVVQGIYYALFGSGNKITMVGKNSCKVELEFDDIKIVRSKNPTKLLVNDIYEADEAQQFINKKFGDMFDVTGYIPQNALKSFILMNPMDKLSFLEKFAFTDIDLSEIKAKCKDHINKKNEELLTCTARLNMAIETADNNEEPDLVEFPLKVKNNNYEKSIKNEYIRLKNCKTNINQATKSLVELNNELSESKLTDFKKEEQHKRLVGLENKQKENQLLFDSFKADYIGEERLKQRQSELKFLVNNRELSLLKETYQQDNQALENMMETEMSNLNNELVKLKSELWTEYSKDEANELISEQEDLLKESERLNYLISENNKHRNKLTLEQIKSALENSKHHLENVKLKKVTHVCPNCKTTLKFENGELFHQKDIIEGIQLEDENKLQFDITKLEKILTINEEIHKIESSYEDKIPDSTDIRSDLKYLREYIYTQTQNESRQIKLESKINNKEMSSSFREFYKHVQSTKTKMENMEHENNNVDSCSSEFNEQELITMIDQQNHIKMNMSSCAHIKNEITREIALLNTVMFVCQRTTLQIEEEIKQLNKQLSEHKNKQIIHENNIGQIEKWRFMMDKLKEYQKWENKVIELQNDESIKQHEYLAAITLKESILEAESIAITNITESINSHARVYLDAFFENDPISVQLNAFKQVKKNTKPQINLEIEYKGMECDLYMLSGGEMARVVLAYTLALAEMFNTPLLMLDECTASLDQETADDVFEAIRENFNGKLTIIIAHQVVTGTFDKIINLDNN